MSKFTIKRKKSFYSIFIILTIFLPVIFHVSVYNQSNLNPINKFFNLLNFINPTPNSPVNIMESSDYTEGNGKDMDTNLSLNLSNEIKDCDINSDFTINTQGWNITKTDLLFNGISNYITQDVETSIPAKVKQLDRQWGMSFNITENRYLQNVTGKIKIAPGNLAVGDDLYLWIYNSTSSGEPDHYIYLEGFDLDGSVVLPFNDWLTLTLNTEVFLDLTNTNNGMFHIVLGQNTAAGAVIEWYYLEDNKNPDNVDEGRVYENLNGFDTVSPNWKLDPYDFTLSLDFGKEFYPSEVNLTVNGTTVADLQRGSGIWSSNQFLIGSNVYFDVSANSSVTYNVNWTCNFVYQTSSGTNFISYASSSIVNWNVTVEAQFFRNSYNKKINVTIPSSWNVSAVYYEDNSEEIWINETYIPNKFVIFNVTTNGTWFISCNSTNFGGNIRIYNNTDLKQAYNYYLNDTILINATINTISAIKANLTIFDTQNNSIYNDQADIINNIASFTPLRLFDYSSRSGFHYIRVSWSNVTDAAVNMTKIFCYNETTNLTLIEGPDPGVVLKGNPVTAKIFYNDTYINNDNSGVVGAMITSNWTLPSMSVIDWGNGSYNLTFQTGFASNRNYTVKVTASKNGYDLATIFIKINVTTVVVEISTQLEILSGIPEPLYVNDTYKYVILNYTQSDGTGITGASIRTDPDWDDAYFQAEDLSLTNTSQKGLYKVFLDTTGTHANQQHQITFSAAKDGFVTSENTSPSFQIVPIPSVIDITGYENITKFEGEVVELIAYYKDNYHIGNPPILSAVSNWTLNTTPSLKGNMDLKIAIYSGEIDLPNLGVNPGTYNVTIKAQAPDFQGHSKNITLNVLPKYNTTIWISNYTRTEIRVGRDLRIEAEIEFSNDSLERENIQLHLVIRYSGATQVDEIKLTNSSGMISYVFAEIPDIDSINITVSYDGSAQINGTSSKLDIDVLPKYETNLIIYDNLIGSYLISGKSYSLNVSLYYNKFGTWTALKGVSVDLDVDYENAEDQVESLSTNKDGLVTIEITPPEYAGSLIIYATFSGNSSVSSALNNTNPLKIAKYNLSIALLDLNPLEVMVGSPLAVFCRVIDSQTRLPIPNVTVSFFLFFGNPNIKLFQQTAITNEEGIASTALILFQLYESLPFLSIGVEFSGDEQTTQSVTTSGIPVIPMTTLKYVNKYAMEYLWLILTVVGIVSAATIYKSYKSLSNRGWKKNIDHMIILTDSGLPIRSWKIGGGGVDATLISGAISGISGIVREMTKSSRKLSSIDHEDKKVLFHYGNIVNGVMITEKDQPIMHEKLAEFVEHFEKKYYYYLTPFDGNLDYFTDADDLLYDVLPFAIPETFKEKLKIIPDIVKKEKRLRELNIEAGTCIMESKIAMAADLYKEAARLAIDIHDPEEFEKFIKNIENLKKRLSKFSLKTLGKIDAKLKNKYKQRISKNIETIKKAAKSADYVTAIKLSTENAKYYLEMDQPEITLELLEKINVFSSEHQKKLRERKKKEHEQKNRTKIQKLKLKASTQIQEHKYLKAADTYNEAAILALQIADKDTFTNLMQKVEEYQKMEITTHIKREGKKEKEIYTESLNKILAELESAKLADQYEKCVELNLRAANISQKLGDIEKYIKFTKAAKEYRDKLGRKES